MEAPEDLAYWIAWHRSPKMGATRFAHLRRAFPSLKDAWHAKAIDLKQIGFDDNLVQELILHRQQTNIEKSWQQINELNLNVVTVADDNYPNLLKQISDPPPLLYYRGNWSCLDYPALAAVGSRQITSYGQQAVAKLIPALAQSGLTIVSGLAYGVDAACHQATLQAGGKTAGVLACGLDQIYPAVNRYLAQKIIDSGGLLLTEFPPGVMPLTHHFPLRNRIIAGLCRATLVIEAAAVSGALITAKLALEYNREVFAVPGNINAPGSVGTNELIKLGAMPALTADDILSAYNLTAATPAQARPTLDKLSEQILKLIVDEPLHSDDIARALSLPAGDIIAKLTLLEVAGLIKDSGQQKFIALE